MATREDTLLEQPSRQIGERSVLRSVAMPTEHGGWSLTLEPAILALLITWSFAGLALSIAALLAFILRTPLKIVLGDLWRKRWLDRSRVALQVATLEILIFVALVVFATVKSDNAFWLPLLIAAPLVAIQLFFDIRSKSRRLLPELCGTVGIGSVASAIALVNGVETKIAFGLWVVVAARGAAAIPYARTQVFRKRSKPVTIWHSDLAQLFAAILVVVGFFANVVPLVPTILIVAIALFNVAALRSAPRPAKIIGLQQMFFGIAVVVATAIAVTV